MEKRELMPPLENDRLFHQMIKEVKDFAILSLNTSGDIITWNKGAERIKGYTAEEIIGSNFRVFYTEEDQRQGIPEMLLKKAALEGRVEDSRWRVKKDKSKFWGTVVLTAIHEADGSIIGFSKITKDLTEKKRAEDELKKLSDQFFSFFNLNPVATIICEVNDLKITFANDAFLKLFSFEKEEALDIKFDDLKFIELDINRVLNEVLEEKKVIKNIECKLNISNKIKYVLLSIDFLKDDSYFISTLMDITDRRESEEKIRYMLESKNKEMEQLVFIASHDLREPLLTIKNYASLLVNKTKESLPDDLKAHFNSITKAADRMEILITGILDYSRLGAQKKLQKVDCNKILQDLLDDLQTLISSSNAEIIIEKLPTINVYPLELKLLFQNLITNAIKFKTPKIIPIIHISSKQVGMGWEFKVSDNGIGIEEKDKEKIFRLFQRLHHRDQYEGSGIGLAHCKKIVELHNGSIWVESTIGMFTNFYFTILT